jgi:hypothetical protein
MVIRMNRKVFVEELYNGLNMGMVAIDHLIDKIQNEKLRDIVIHQRKQYGDLKEKIMQTSEYKYDDDKLKHQIMLESMIDLKTIWTDDAKIVKMLIEGCNQSIMTITHLLNQEEQVDMKMKNYAHDFEEISKSYIEALKRYL